MEEKQVRSRLGKVSVLMVTILVAVGVMGAGFASWTDSLVINGIVETASFDVGIRDVTATLSTDVYGMGRLDWGPNFEDGGLLYPGSPSMVNGSPDPQYGSATNEEGKNIASTNSYNVIDTFRFTKDVFMLEDDAEFYGAVREEILNAYPWYASGVVICIANNGSIPIHITDVDFQQVSGDCGVLGWLQLDEWRWCVHTATTCSGVTVGSGGIAGLEEFLSGWPNGTPFQLEPCRTLWLQLYWHFEQEVDVDGDGDLDEMPQNASCAFDITITAEQWDE